MGWKGNADKWNNSDSRPCPFQEKRLPKEDIETCASQHGAHRNFNKWHIAWQSLGAWTALRGCWMRGETTNTRTHTSIGMHTQNNNESFHTTYNKRFPKHAGSIIREEHIVFRVYIFFLVQFVICLSDIAFSFCWFFFCLWEIDNASVWLASSIESLQRSLSGWVCAEQRLLLCFYTCVCVCVCVRWLTVSVLISTYM